jgi:hypothetical protein
MSQLSGAISASPYAQVLVAKGLIDVNLSRKLIHVTSGSTFILTWVLFRRGPVERRRDDERNFYYVLTLGMST